MTATAWSRTGRTLDVLAVAGVVLWLVQAVSRLFLGAVPWPQSVVDYTILYQASRQVIATGTYPPGYPYPPSAVVLHYTSALFPFPVSAALWLVVTLLATLACWFILAGLLELPRHPGRLSVLLPAMAATASFIVWDLRSQNCNMVFLAALLFGVDNLHKGRPRSAGFCLALSFSLKLFSVLSLPYLLWTGRRRELAWTLGFILLFWLVFPAVLLGVEGTVRAYGGWLREMEEASDPQRLLNHPIVISLHASAARLAGGDAWRAGLVLNAVRGLWLATFLAAWALSRGRKGGAYGLLTDVSVLTLAPVAVSPYLEPYHAVPFAVPALLLLHGATDGTRPRSQRLFGVVLFAVVLVVGLVPVDWRLRGLMVNLKLLLAVVGIVFLARVRPQALALTPKDEVATQRRSAA
jgi:hypothetical protein